MKTVLLIAAFSMLLLAACKKDNTTTTPVPVCTISGNYSGTSTSSQGNSSIGSYRFQDNNFVTGSITPAGPNVTFGGYRNTCDSVFMSVYYTGNSSYYLLKAKILNNGTTISGTFNNLTNPSDFGTFIMSK